MTRNSLLQYVVCFSLFGISFSYQTKSETLVRSFTQYTNIDGLIQNTIKDLVQDKTGFIWIGTENGLVRFDGLRFEKIKAPKGRTVVLALSLDSQGRIWVNWHDFPKSVYNPTNDEWMEPGLNLQIDNFSYDFVSEGDWPIDKRKTIEKVLSAEQILKVKEISKSLNNNLSENGIAVKGYTKSTNGFWIGEPYTLIYINIENEKITKLPLENLQEHFKGFVEFENASYMCTNHAIYKLLPAPSIIRIFDIPTREANSVDKNFCVKHNSSIIHTFNNDGIETFNLSTHEPKTYTHPDLNKITFDSKNTSIYSNQKSILGVSDNFVVEISNSNMSIFKVPAHYNFSFYDDGPILKSHDGNIWLGTDNSGLFKISNLKNKFDTVYSPIKDKYLYRKAILLQNELWMGSQEGGITRWNRTTDQWKHYSLDSIPRKPVRAIIKDNSDSIWAGTASGDLIKYNRVSDKFDIIKKGSTYESGINVLLSDENNIWFESGGKLQKFDISSKTNTYIHFEPATTTPTYIKALAFDSNKNIIIGTHGKGMFIADQQGNIIRKWADELTSKSIFSVYQDSFDNIWAGTWGGGLYRINPRTTQIQVFNTNSGLSDNTVFGIVPGEKGDLWLSSYNGLMQFKSCISDEWPCAPNIVYFDGNDGLQGKEFDAESFALLDSGEIYFAGTSGINVFKPIDFKFNNLRPKLAVSGMYINNVRYFGEFENITLEPDFRNLIIKFIALDFHDPKSNLYQYKLDGDKNWRDLKEPRIEFSLLKNGSHLLKVRGSNNDGVWSKSSLDFMITVKPPHYLSWVAKVFYFIFLVLVVITWTKIREHRLRQQAIVLEDKITKRTKQLKDQKEQLKNANFTQNKLYSSISHEIKTPLTILLAPIEEMKNEGNIKAEWLETIERQSQELKYFINNLVNLTSLKTRQRIKYGSHEIAPYLESLVNDFQFLAKQKQIKLSLEVMTEPLAAVRSYRRSLNIIMNNLLENSIKQIPQNGKIEIIAIQTGTDITIMVEDNGPGIPVDKLDSIFEYGETNNNNDHWLNSLGIGLSISQETAKTLGGELFVANCDLGGACFGLTLPIAAKNLEPINDNSNLVKPASDYHHQEFDPNDKYGKPLILIIDDNPSILTTLQHQLNPLYKTHGATTAKLGKEFICKHNPDLVICDVMLPDQTGFELLKEIKTDITVDHTIMLMLTAMEEETAKLKSMEYHADAHISKPYSKKELLITIQNLLFISKRKQQHVLLKDMSTRIDKNKQTQESDTIINKLIDILKTNYSNQYFKAPQMAQAMGMSLSTLQRNLKSETQLTLGQIMYNYRIDRAKSMIKKNMAFKEISVNCGFSSAAHFSTKFKNIVNMSPNDYLKSDL